MGKKHKKHRERFKHQTTTQPKELSLRLSIPLSSLPKYSKASSNTSIQSNEPELSCRIQIQKAGLAFVIPKKKDTAQDIDTSLQGKKHKKKKQHHYHDNKPEPLHIPKPHDSQVAHSDTSSQSAEKHSSPQRSGSNSPLRKLSIVVPKLNSNSIPTSSPLLTSSPVQIPPVEQHLDNDSEMTKQVVTTVQTIQSSTAEPAAKVPTHQVISSEQCSTSVTNGTSEELQKLRTNIKYALKTIHYQLEKKDPQGIFAEPVTDEIAPGYSALISNPMDFSTMAKKIDTLQYQSVDEYKEDFVLMCNNCMTYNPEDTVFYQAAKKLLSSGLKLIAKEAAKKLDLLTLPTIAAATVGNYSRSSTPLSFQPSFSKRSISPAPSSSHEHPSVAPTTRLQSTSNSLMCRIPLSVLNRHSIQHPLPTSGGITQELKLPTFSHGSLVSSITDGVTSSLSSTAQWVADTMSATAEPPYDDTGLTKLHVGWISDNSDESSDEEEYDNVLEQVQAAAAAAHEAAVNRKSVSLAYLDTSEAGRATLNILNPDSDDDVNLRDVDMTELEALIAEGEEANKKLELEHSRHKTTPVTYLMYGPYGAFAPYFDSSFATLTRMDSSLLYSVYGDDMGVTYAHSLQRFVRGTSSFACEMAEAILNGLTSNKHRLLKEKLTEQRDKLFHMSQQQQQQPQQQQKQQQQVQQQPQQQQEQQQHQAQQQLQQQNQQPQQQQQQQQQPQQQQQQQQTQPQLQQQDQLQLQQLQQQQEQEESKESGCSEKHSTDYPSTAEADMKENNLVSTTTAAITNTTAIINPVTTTAIINPVTTTATTIGSVQQQVTKEKPSQPVLDKNVEILLQLQQLQNERLSRVPFTLPQSQEAATALHVAENLKQLTSKVTPGDVVSVQALQIAMGSTVTTANHVTTPYTSNT